MFLQTPFIPVYGYRDSGRIPPLAITKSRTFLLSPPHNGLALIAGEQQSM
jgi:hypothetical protein